MPANPMKVRFDDSNLKHLEREALRLNRPITTIINRALDEARSSMSLKQFFEIIDSYPSVFRIKASSTTAEMSRICELIRSGMLKNIIFGAKKCAMNNRTLSGFAEFGDFVVLFDNIRVNHAREPRIMEVENLLQVVAGSSTVVEPTY